MANIDHESKVPGKLSKSLQHVLLTAALASPHPDAPDAKSHPTDSAIIEGALDAGFKEQLYVQHDAEVPFDPLRSFHATLVQNRLCVKGAPEALLPRCNRVLRGNKRRPLDKAVYDELLAHIKRLGGLGLRILLVAEGSPETDIDDPSELTVLGFRRDQ